MKTIVTELINPHFFISPNTADSLINKLRGEFPDIKEKYGKKGRGLVNGDIILYLEATIQEEDKEKFRGICQRFTQRYEYMRIAVMFKKD